MSKNLPQGEVLLIPNMSTYLTLCVKLASPVRSTKESFARLCRFSEGKWRRKPTRQSRLLPKANMSAERDLRNFFEKKFLKNFPKTFPLLLTFVLIKIENFRAEGDGNSPSLFTVHCPLSTTNSQVNNQNLRKDKQLCYIPTPNPTATQQQALTSPPAIALSSL